MEINKRYFNGTFICYRIPNPQNPNKTNTVFYFCWIDDIPANVSEEVWENCNPEHRCLRVTISPTKGFIREWFNGASETVINTPASHFQTTTIWG